MATAELLPVALFALRPLQSVGAPAYGAVLFAQLAISLALGLTEAVPAAAVPSDFGEVQWHGPQKFEELYPAAALTMVLHWFAGPPERLARGLGRCGRGLVHLVAVVCLAITLVLDLNDIGIWHIPGNVANGEHTSEGKEISEVKHGIPAVLVGIPHAVGVFLLLWLAGLPELKACSGNLSPPPQHSVALELLGRISFGVNLGHLFVIHVTQGFLQYEPLELTAFNLLAQCLATYVMSVIFATLLYAGLEHPAQLVSIAVILKLSAVQQQSSQKSQGTFASLNDSSDGSREIQDPNIALVPRATAVHIPKKKHGR